jgi:hypothetical protein
MTVMGTIRIHAQTLIVRPVMTAMIPGLPFVLEQQRFVTMSTTTVMEQPTKDALQTSATAPTMMVMNTMQRGALIQDALQEMIVMTILTDVAQCAIQAGRKHAQTATTTIATDKSTRDVETLAVMGPVRATKHTRTAAKIANVQRVRYVATAYAAVRKGAAMERAPLAKHAAVALTTADVLQVGYV